MNQLPYQGYHDDGSCQVIEYGRQEKSDKTNNPEEGSGVLGFYSIRNVPESPVRIYKFNDSHRAQQKEQDLRDGGEVFVQFVAHKLAMHFGRRHRFDAFLALFDA